MADDEKKGLIRRGAELAKSKAGDFAAEQKRYHSADAKQERADLIRHRPVSLAATYLGGEDGCLVCPWHQSRYAPTT